VSAPDGLQLLAVALLLGERGGEGRGGAVLDGRGGRRPLPLQRVQLVDCLRAHRRRAVVVAHAVLVLLPPVRLDPREPVRRRHLRRAEGIVRAACKKGDRNTASALAAY
jgi:hypothetical protein